MIPPEFNWLDTKEYPFKAHYLTVNNSLLHYIDEGEGEVLLFVHGTPSWSFDFRNVIKILSKKYRCIALDHIGFGLSDKPKSYKYTIENHSKNLTRLILELGLKNIHMVLHDFGGPIGFTYALQHVDNVKSISILNSWIGSAEKDPEFIKTSKILKSPLLPFLYLYLNFSPKFLLPKSFGDKKLDSKLLKQYTKPFNSKNQRYGTLGFAKSLLNEQALFEQQLQKSHKLKNTPIQLIWGEKDVFCTERYLQKLQQAFPQAETFKLPSAGHFPQEEEPKQVAEGIEQFITIKSEERLAV